MTRINEHPNERKRSYLRILFVNGALIALISIVAAFVTNFLSETSASKDDAELNYRPALYSRHAQDHFTFMMNRPDKEVLFDSYLELLDDEAYRALDSLFEDFNSRLIEDIQVEWEFVELFKQNPRSGARYLNQLEQWHEETSSAYSRLMKASYYANAGWETRGNKTIGETSYKQISQMNELHQLAIAELQSLLEVQPNLFPAYLVLISMERAQSHLVPLEDLAEQINARFPGSYHVAEVVMKSYQPRWGGSLREISSYYEDHIKPYEAINAPLIRFRGYELGERGWHAMKQRHVKRCVNLYTEAFYWGVDPHDLGIRAWCLEELNRTVQALDDIQLSLQIEEDDWGRGQESYYINRLKRHLD